VKTPVAVLAEDEPTLRAEIRTALRQLWPELVVAEEASDGNEALCAIERHAPDIVFLDIQMPGASGLEVAQRVSGRAHVVFISAFPQYALTAFEKGALDYILKPLSLERLKDTIARLKDRVSSQPADIGALVELLKGTTARGQRYLKWITVSHGEELRVLAVAEICYLRADHKYTTAVTKDGAFLLRSSLKEMRDALDPDLFWQIHRSVIVNVGSIDGICRSFRGSLEIKLKGRDELLPVSAAHAHLFRQA
jgi:DNA-binding LytR/AlgR family response regulator